MELDLTHHIGICDLLAAVGGDVFIFDDVEGFGAVDTLTFSVLAFGDALSEAAKFIRVGLDPGFCKRRMFSELAIFEHLYGGLVKYSQRQCVRRGCGEEGCIGTAEGMGAAGHGVVSSQRWWRSVCRGLGSAGAREMGNRAIHQRGVGRHGV